MREFRLRSENARRDGLFVLEDRTLEAFGFGFVETRRVNLDLMEPVELVERGETYLKLDGASPGIQQFAQVVDRDDPELQRLLGELGR